MGILNNLLNGLIVQTRPEMPTVVTAMTDANISNILNGVINVIPVRRIILKTGEECLFCDYAVRISEKLRVVGRRGTGGNISFKVMKGMYYHTGNRGSNVIREMVPEYQQGKLYITNKRIIFSSDAMSFQQNISSLVSYRTEDGCLILQFSNTSYKIFLPVSLCAEKVIEYIL